MDPEVTPHRGKESATLGICCHWSTGYEMNRQFVAGCVALAPFYFALLSCADCPPVEKNSVTRALLIGEAKSLSRSVDTLKLIEAGSMDVARSTIMTHVRSGLTIMRELQPQAGSEEAQLIAETIRDTEQYLATPQRHSETEAKD